MNTHQLVVDIHADLTEDEIRLIAEKIGKYTESLLDMVPNATVFVILEDSFDI